MQRARKDGWMNGVLGNFFALSRLNWAGDSPNNEKSNTELELFELGRGQPGLMR